MRMREPSEAQPSPLSGDNVHLEGHFSAYTMVTCQQFFLQTVIYVFMHFAIET